MPIKIIPIIPKRIIRLPIAEIIRRAKRTVREESNIHRRMFGRFTATWSAANKPDWDHRIKDNGQDYEVVLSTKSTPFVFVERGTRVRYRKMSPDFVPKTKPRVIGSGAGAGRALGFAVKPGITARNIRTEIAERRQPRFVRKMVFVMRIRPSAVGGGIGGNI